MGAWVGDEAWFDPAPAANRDRKMAPRTLTDWGMVALLFALIVLAGSVAPR